MNYDGTMNINLTRLTQVIISIIPYGCQPHDINISMTYSYSNIDFIQPNNYLLNKTHTEK